MGVKRKYTKYTHTVGRTVFGDIVIEDTKTAMIIKSKKTKKRLVYPIPTSWARRRAYSREARQILGR